jgi:hypothetical protein
MKRKRWTILPQVDYLVIGWEFSDGARTKQEPQFCWTGGSNPTRVEIETPEHITAVAAIALYQTEDPYAPARGTVLHLSEKRE